MILEQKASKERLISVKKSLASSNNEDREPAKKKLIVDLIISQTATIKNSEEN